MMPERSSTFVVRRHSLLMLRKIVLFALAWMCPCSIESAPLHIHATQKITCDQTRNACEAFGDVKVTQDGLCLQGDHMRMRFTDAPKTIQTLDASGHVRLTKGPLKALGKKGAYSAATHTITLQGDPVLTFHNIQATSDHPVIFDLTENVGTLQKPHITLPTQRAALTSETMTFHILSHGSKNEAQINLNGNVLFATPEVVIAAGHATYNTQTRILDVSKNVKIIDNDRIAIVDKASYHVDKRWFFWHGQKPHQAKGLFRKHPQIRKVLPPLS
jgi:lipopolysaccharide transport protein LptA